jgi:hypothetical protein
MNNDLERAALLVEKRRVDVAIGEMRSRVRRAKHLHRMQSPDRLNRAQYDGLLTELEDLRNRATKMEARLAEMSLARRLVAAE